jgi:hypothetical protein
VPIVTTVSGARAAVQAISAMRAGNWDVAAIQDYFPHLARGPLTEGSQGGASPAHAPPVALSTGARGIAGAVAATIPVP